MDENLKKMMERLSADQAKMDKIMEQAKSATGLDFTKVTEVSGSAEEKAAAFRAVNDSCAKTMKEIEEYKKNLDAVKDAEGRKAVVDKFKHAGGDDEKKGGKSEDRVLTKAEVLDVSALVMKAAQDAVGKGQQFDLKAFLAKEREFDGVSLKTLMDSVNSWAPQAIRTGLVVDKAVRPIELIDLIPAGRTNMNAVAYMEETTLDESQVAEAAEAAQFGEMAIALNEKSSPVRKIAAFIPVTDEQLEDVPQAQGLINNRLPAALRRRLDYQLMNGDGNAPNLRGLLNVASIGTYLQSAVNGDKPIDALRRAMTLIRTIAFRQPNAVIMNPLDWDGIRLMKTNDGVYIWGSPSEAGPERVWGITVAMNNSLAQYTSVVADLSETELAEKRGITLKVSDSHSDYFIKGKQAIRADVRAAFVVRRPAAVYAVTLTP
jgi:HK97 family phage major capsid protein